MNILKKEQEILLTIRKIGINGEGIGYYKKLAVFVDNALVGDVVVVFVTEVHKRYAKGQIINFKTKARSRVVPFCKFYSECGGCNIMHMQYEEQLKTKKQIVEESLNRYLNVNYNVTVNDVVGMDDPYFYRNKSALPLTYKKKKLSFGLYKENSNDIVEIDHCKITHKYINRLYEKIIDIIEDYDISLYDNKTKEGCIKRVVARVANVSKEMQVTIVYNKFDAILLEICDKIKKIKDVASVYLNRHNTESHEVFGNDFELIKGKEQIRVEMNGNKFDLSPNSFFQLNYTQSKKMYDHLLEILKKSPSKSLLDAYSGVGTIGIYLSKYANKVTFIEENKEASKNTLNNIKINDISNTSIKSGKVEVVYKKLADRGERFDTIVVDPPRVGLNANFIDAINKTPVSRFIYISCNPSTLAKDLDRLKTNYKIETINLFDMFPQTAHVESIVVLKKK